jgi:hypothetical protein
MSSYIVSFLVRESNYVRKANVILPKLLATTINYTLLNIQLIYILNMLDNLTPN